MAWKENTQVRKRKASENLIVPVCKTIAMNADTRCKMRNWKGPSHSLIHQCIDDTPPEVEEVSCNKLKTTSPQLRLINQQISQINVML